MSLLDSLRSVVGLRPRAGRDVAPTVKVAGGRVVGVRGAIGRVKSLGKTVGARLWGEPIPLRYFETVLAVEIETLNARRTMFEDILVGRGPIKVLPRPRSQNHKPSREDGKRRTPSPSLLFGSNADKRIAAAPRADLQAIMHAKTRPLPLPCTATGLALSGGGIRSAALSLGAIQALQKNERITSLDYLSSVSGGGYIGSSLSAAMSVAGGGRFPFGTDVSDSDALAHLRNYSNYLMPRGRSGIRNGSEAAAILLRGFAGNAVIVLFGLLFAAILTIRGYSNGHGYALREFGFIPALADSFLSPERTTTPVLGSGPFGLTLRLCWTLLAVLVAWAVARRAGPNGFWVSDTSGFLLRVARWLIIAVVVSFVLDLQPFAAVAIGCAKTKIGASSHKTSLGALVTAAGAFATSVAAFGSRIGKFLESSARSTGTKVLLTRLATKAMLVLAALVVPLLLWCSYLALVAAALEHWRIPPWLAYHPLDWLAAHVRSVPVSPRLSFWPHIVSRIKTAYERLPAVVHTEHGPLYSWICLASLAVVTRLNANSYSLNRFYRDRLSKAFLFITGSIDVRTEEPVPLNALKLSALQNNAGPYHILNAALNVQGSKEANKRGRNADFFTFTPHHVGSDLTLYAPTAGSQNGVPAIFEAVERDLDLATAMAISGAAVSANMGTSTVRLLSPTLALLNIRLGYWLTNPRFQARRESVRKRLRAAADVLSNFFLPAEMLNLLDENGHKIYLTDGGHIENLGVYELLKRGCGLVVVVDAEADPTLAFGSLQRVERYARIDLGVRIVLPWEQIAAAHAAAAKALVAREPCAARGPHCAVGKIFYENGAEGMLVYFKSSLSGDEKDYVRDYKIRNPSFPHETTGDQFFTEEQFEMYRSLGFHIVDGFFRGDDVAFLSNEDGYLGRDDLVDQFNRLCPASTVAS